MDKRKNYGIEGGEFICKNTEAKTKLKLCKKENGQMFESNGAFNAVFPLTAPETILSFE